MFPETILYGTHWVKYREYKFTESVDVAFLVEYDAELALAGLPPYYVHRERRKGDKMKNQRTVSELPIPEPDVITTFRSPYNENYYADVVIVETFEEVIAFLSEYPSGRDQEGRYVDDMLRFREERKCVERDARIAREDEKREWDALEAGSQQYLF